MPPSYFTELTTVHYHPHMRMQLIPVVKHKFILDTLASRCYTLALILLVLIIAFGALCAQLVLADTLDVCPNGCSYKRIGTALWDAQPGDTIMVGAGVYYESIGLKPSVRVQGAGPDVTFLISEGRPAVVGTGALTSTCVLDGFTIIGGANGNPTSRGGAIYIDDGAQEIISNNVISGCIATEKGGGIYIQGEDTAPIIINNVFVGNIVHHVGGAAIYIEDAAPVISGNTFVDNLSYTDGGALAVYTIDYPYYQATITNNMFISNTALAKGGAIYLQSAQPLISSNSILSNTALMGAGIFANYYSEASIENNLIAYNTTLGTNNTHIGGGLAIVNGSDIHLNRNTIRQNRAGRGDGIYVESAAPCITNNVLTNNGSKNILLNAASPHIVNNTILGSNLQNTVGIDLWGLSYPRIVNNIIAFEEYGIQDDKNGTPTILYNNLWQNQVDYGGENIDATNLGAPPRFRDPASGDYHLEADSVLIDAGYTADAPPFDFEGDPRPIDGDGDSVAIADIGADEYSPPETATPTATATITNTPTPTATPTSITIHLYLPIIWKP